MGKFVGKRVVPRHAGIWSNRRAYEPLEIVLEESTGDSYISRKDVPAGTALSQEEYWALCQRFSEQMKLFRDAVDQDVAGMHTLTNDTVKDIKQSLKDTDQTITQKLSNTEQAVEQRASEAETKLAQGKSQMEQTAAALNARMDGIVAGSTGEGDVEVADIRTDPSGKNYVTAGDAVRAITAGLPEKFDFTDKNAIKSGDNVSSVELLTRTAHYSYEHTGTGYVGCFLQLGKYDDLKGKRLMAVYQNNGIDVSANIVITNSRSAWSSLDGSVMSVGLGTVKLNEDNGFFQEVLIDFDTEKLNNLMESKPDGTFYLVFRLENTRVEQAGDVYIYAYDPDAISDLFWKYYVGSEKIRQIMTEVIAARTDSRGVPYPTLGTRMNLVDSILVPALRVASVISPRDNPTGFIQSEDGGFSGINTTYGGTIVFDYDEYMAVETHQWSSLHAYVQYSKETISSLKSYDDLILKVRVDGLKDNPHIGETVNFSYYVNAVGSWSRIVNPLKTTGIKVGHDNSIRITKEEIDNILADSSTSLFIVLVLGSFNNDVVADMGRVQIKVSLADTNHVSIDGFTSFVDSAGSALTAAQAGEAAHADRAGYADEADHANSASAAMIADNFFINPPDELLNIENVRFSPGMDTLDIPSAPVINMTCHGQTALEFNNERTVSGNHITNTMTMKIGYGSSQIHNQGYQKGLGNCNTISQLLQKIIEGWKDYFVCTVEDCENYPKGSGTGSYSQRMLIATTTDSKSATFSISNATPILKRSLGGGKKMYLWKITPDSEKAQEILDALSAKTQKEYWNGIWHTRYSEADPGVTWVVKWYWMNYAFTDGSISNEEMMDFFNKKYMYWGSNVNHYLLEERFKKLDAVKEKVDELDSEIHQEKLKKDIHIVCWGDSLTAGGGWTTTLANLAGGTVYNGGTGGENARTIMARQGADVMTINHVTIPAACEPVTIATRTEDKGIMTEAGKKVTPLLQGGAHVNPVMIGDIEGTLKWTGSNYADQTGIWTFTRSTPGEKVVIDRPTAIRTNFDRIHNGSDEIMIIFMGQNGGYADIPELIDMHRKMIDHFKGKEYVVLGLSSGTAAQRKEYEDAMKAAFGRRFISLREYLAAPIYDKEGNIVSCYGLADQGLEPGEKEYNGVNYVALEEIATGTVPHQIITDSVHYTAGTKTVIGTMLYKKMKELGILE